MPLHLVTGYKGSAHVTSADQGAFNAALVGLGDYVCSTGKQFEAQIMSNNSIRIYDGDLMMKGRHVNLKVDTYEDVTIENGTQGTNRNDLIVCRYTKDATGGQEAAAFVVVKGAESTGVASDPAVTSGDILSGAILHEMSLYRVKIEGLSIVAIEKLFSLVTPIGDIVEQVNAGQNSLAELKTDVNATKKSVSDGKTLIAAAITEKKVQTAADATFAVMAENISKIICGSGTAKPADVLKGKTFTGNDGIEKEGTLEVQSILSFSAAPYSSNQITFTWKNPAKGAFSGVIIVGKTGSYPTSISDGKRWYKGFGNNTKASGTSTATVNGFTSGTKYYFRAFSYALKNDAEWIHGTSYTATASTTKGLQTFTESGIFTVPEGVRSIDIFCVGGGGSGGGCGETSQENPSCAGGGAGGYTSTKKSYAVTPGQEFAVTIGAGAAAKSGTGGDGGTTSFGSVVSAKGGYGGIGARQQEANGGNGGSGGGGAYSLSKVYPGGSDGSDGFAGMVSQYTDENHKAKGQGTTTRAFGETTGTLYAGGGGADSNRATGAGGEGGGGSGRQDGTANTGGGGGGYGSSTTSNPKGGAGGSGICIVRWGY